MNIKRMVWAFLLAGALSTIAPPFLADAQTPPQISLTGQLTSSATALAMCGLTGQSTASVQLTGGSGTWTFKISNDGANYYVSPNDVTHSTSSSGLFYVTIASAKCVQVSTAGQSGSTSVVIVGGPGSVPPPGGGNVGSVTIASPIPLPVTFSSTPQPVTFTTPVPVTFPSPQPVTIATALPAGTNVIGHVITDTGSTTAATQSTAANLNATVVFPSPQPVTIATALPAGANTIGAVTGSGNFAATIAAPFASYVNSGGVTSNALLVASSGSTTIKLYGWVVTVTSTTVTNNTVASLVYGTTTTTPCDTSQHQILNIEGGQGGNSSIPPIGPILFTVPASNNFCLILLGTGVAGAASVWYSQS